MSSVTIPKTEYEQLKRQARAYQRVASRLFESVLGDSVTEVVNDFRKTGLYSEEFLSDLGAGLGHSSYKSTHAHKRTQKRS